MYVAYLGNFRPQYSTENDYAIAWRSNDHNVMQVQEGVPGELEIFIEDLRHTRPDLVIWTRTEDLAKLNGEALQWRLLAECRRLGVPIVGIHLDRWWGLDRQWAIERDPFFRVDLLLTADGGHQEYWGGLGLKHRWLPPGISERWCQPGTFRDE